MQSPRFFAKAGVQCTGVRFPDTCSDTRLHNEEFVVAALMRPSLGRLPADRQQVSLDARSTLIFKDIE